MAKTEIFNDFESFQNRSDKSVNGVNHRIAKIYPDWELQNETNVGCWNCTCCNVCINCVDCYECKNCKNCEDCSHCNDCEYCTNCHGCDSYKDKDGEDLF